MRMLRRCDSKGYILHDDFAYCFYSKTFLCVYFLLVNNSRDLEEQARHTAPFLKLRWQIA